MLLRRVSALSVLLLSLGGFVVLANPKPDFFPPLMAQSFEGPPGHNWSKPRLMEELNLTQEQQQQLQAIRSQYKDQISQQQDELRQASEELRSLMTSDADANQIRPKHQQVQQLRQQLEALHFESMLAMREVLTPEQRQEFAQLMERRRDEFRNEMRNRRGQEF